MTNELYEWLRNHFYRDNHNKYKHLFDKWLNNITGDQIDGFNKQMYNEKNNIIK